MSSDASSSDPDGLTHLIAGHIGIDLAELHAVETVFRLAARRGAERDVPDLDIQHELQVQLAQRGGGLDQLCPGLRRQRHRLGVDPQDLVEAIHVDDSAGRRRARRQRVIAAHGPDGTRILDRVAQDLLQLSDGRRTDDHCGVVTMPPS